MIIIIKTHKRLMRLKIIIIIIKTHKRLKIIIIIIKTHKVKHLLNASSHLFLDFKMKIIIMIIIIILYYSYYYYYYYYTQHRKTVGADIGQQI